MRLSQSNGRAHRAHGKDRTRRTAAQRAAEDDVMTFALRGRMRLAALLVLASLSGCLTPAALAEMAQRAEVLSKEAKTQDCADAAANAASAVVVALKDMTSATRMSDPVRSPKPALRVAEVACLECVRDKDCSADEECVGGHCQKRRK